MRKFEAVLCRCKLRAQLSSVARAGPITVIVVGFSKGGKVRLGITARPSANIHRREVFDAIKREVVIGHRESEVGPTLLGKTSLLRRAQG